jgi:cardiolipin synthase
LKKTEDKRKAGNGKRSGKGWKKMVVFVMVSFHVVGFFSSIHAVMGTRTPQGAIAWGIALNTFPYVTVPAYWILGRSRFQGYVTSRNEEDREIRHVNREAEKLVGSYRVAESEMSDAPGGRAAQRLAGMPYLRGNDVKLLIDGEATFASIFEGIDAAREYVLFQFFIVHDDELGREAKEHLVAKAKEGVPVFFLYDEIGSHDLPESYKEELRAAGAKVAAFNTRKGRSNRFQINFRNHRKVVVVDGRTAWVGGHNVGDEYMGKSEKFGHWRDTHIRIDGPAALAAQLSFIEDWNWATNAVPELNWTPRPAEGGDMPVLIVPTGPADDLETAALMFIHAINSARERIWIATPYFVPDGGVVYALQLAGLRGVDVRILIPSIADHLLSYLAAFNYFKDAGATGVRFFRYGDGFIHEKAMLIDDRIGVVGTANFDNRSFRLNFEITGVVADPSFAGEVEAMFEEDFLKSKEVMEDELAGRSFWFRLGVRLAGLTAPIQ